MDKRGLIIFIIYAISGAASGAIFSWALGLPAWWTIGIFGGISGVGGLIFAVEKSAEEKMLDDECQLKNDYQPTPTPDPPARDKITGGYQPITSEAKPKSAPNPPPKKP
jgi:hypothetical protein